MRHKFTTVMSDGTLNIEQENDSFFVNGKLVDVRYTRLDGDTLLISIGNRHFEVYREHQLRDDGGQTVFVNGKHIAVLVEDEKDAVLKSFDLETATKLHASVIKAPMPGKITKVLVSVGEFVEAGQGVLILEAMKMENEIKTPTAGIVKAVHIHETTAVEKGTVLVEIQ
jgi:biotin carboxyl carrier protein